MSEQEENPGWNFTINVRIDSPPPATGDARSVADKFGLGGGFSQVLYDDFRLDIQPGTIFAVTGPSGSGKSVLLKRIAEGCPQARPLRLAELAACDRPAVEAIGGDSLAGRLEMLSRCGLAEAMVMASPARNLSGGQLYRLALAEALWQARLSGRGAIVLADEFAATLDDQTAEMLCRQVRKLITGSPIAMIVATARSELLAALQPDKVIIKELGRPPRIVDPPRKWNCKKFENDPARWRIRRGTIADYHALARFHYIAGPPAAHKRVYVIRPPICRGQNSYGCRLLGKKDEPAAVVVVSPPVIAVRGRNIASAGRYVRGGRKAALGRLNSEVECISRVIVHPIYRSCGLSVRLVRHVMKTSTMPIVEALAIMGKLHPFFELAGMMSWHPASGSGYVYYDNVDIKRTRRGRTDAKPSQSELAEAHSPVGRAGSARKGRFCTRNLINPACNKSPTLHSYGDGALHALPATSTDRPGNDRNQERSESVTNSSLEWINHPPTNRRELAELVRREFKIIVSDVSLCPHHNCPLDYLSASFFEQRDLLVWANRGGGKTMLAAVATILDAVFRRPAEIRVLGGSFDQSDRLAEYIRELLAGWEQLLEGSFTRRRARLIGGSEIRMLAQSQRAVRGQHVQKIRCDEVDLFDAEVWRAVQFATRSSATSRGSIEVLSTLHRPGGLMQELVEAARSTPPDGSGYKLIQWCLWEVIERCGAERRCQECLLADDCQGVARRGSGFFSIDDAVAIKARSSRAAWESEMLCKGAARQYLVFEEFDSAKHVRAVDWQADWPTYRAIDFGYRNPLVCLWIQITPAGCVNVIDEYVRSRLPLTSHAKEILRRDPGPVMATYVDPAGRAKESTSGAACTEMLAAAGIPCTSRASAIAEGLELIRAALAPAAGEASLLISPRCRQLIDAFNSYHYGDPSGSSDRNTPVKDGPDHLIDALRYFFINRMRPKIAVSRGRY